MNHTIMCAHFLLADRLRASFGIRCMIYYGPNETYNKAMLFLPTIWVTISPEEIISRSNKICMDFLNEGILPCENKSTLEIIKATGPDLRDQGIGTPSSVPFSFHYRFI